MTANNEVMDLKHEIALDIRGLSAGYDGETIIEDIDLKVMEGEFLGIIGPNGGGKSTLLKVILGLIEPIKGEVRIFGEPPVKGRRYLGYVPQYTVFDRDFPITVQNVVMMGRRRMKGSRPWYSDADKIAVKKSLTDVGMWEFRKKHIGQLSGGQKQRVYIARALASKPRILLLDEPTASVDAKVEDSIYKLLRVINDEITIVLVTHDIGIISSHVSNVACMNRHIFKGDGKELTAEMLQESYQCPVDLIAHGLPHRVLPYHDKHN